MSETPNVHSMATDAVINFTKLYDKSVVSAGAFNDSDLVVVDCGLSGKRLVIATDAKTPGKVGVGVGNKQTGVLAETMEFETKTFSSGDILKMMEDNFVKSRAD